MRKYTKFRHIALSLAIAIGLLLYGSTSAHAAYSQEEIAFIQWYEASPSNQAYYEWVIFMEDPANAEWFEWKTSQVEVSSDSIDRGSIDSILRNVFGTEYRTALRVAKCESRLDPNAISDTNDHGLLQINATTWNKPWHSDPVAQYIGNNWHNVYDPYHNALMAKKIRDRYGWSKWSCY